MVSSKNKPHDRKIGTLTEKIRIAVGLVEGPTPSTPLDQPPADGVANERALPERYLVKENREGRFLACVEVSNIQVRIERGQVVSSSAARKAPSGTIFLDGAAQGEPFVDAAKRVYNFDHHEGCVRSFTLATCEQLMIMILKGLDLSGESWTVVANEPDLDTVLAIWLVLNHRHVFKKERLRRRLMPLVRLQGVIDGHGFDLAELTGFPEGLQETTLATIRALRTDEVELKREGQWDDLDFLEYTAARLGQIDELYFTPGDLVESPQIEELGRAWIAPQRVAIGCRSTTGIYEVEAFLKEVHGDRLGLVLLARDDNVYTVRQSDPFLRTNLQSLYRRLNLFDPRSRGDQRWGGSYDIGGSPRSAGTGLSFDHIMAICRWVYDPPPLGRRIATVMAAFLAAIVVSTAALLASGGWSFGGIFTRPTSGLATGAVALLGLTLLVALLGRSRQWAHPGLGLPRSWSFLALLPLTAAAALGGGAWAPLHLAFSGAIVGGGGWMLALAMVTGVIGYELLFRGLCLGMMINGYPVMLWTGRRFVSFPNIVAAAISTAAIALLTLPPFWLSGGVASLALWIASAFAMGLACGAARERSGSVWAAVILHLASAAIAWALLPRLFGA